MQQASDGKTYAERQAEGIQAIRLTEDLHEKVSAYADDNSMSVSEAMREILTSYANGASPAPERKRRTRRLAIWIDPITWGKFKVRAARDKSTLVDAVEAAIKETL